ncbi:MAG: LemA family protein [Endomicrobiales bacterium]|nr:LemA family protein [Endomicrobiales bacterium]
MGVFLLVLVFLGLGAAIVAVYGVGLYNSLIRIKVNTEKSWANIEVLLKQRYDEIPKLVKVCEGYMKYERETLEKITQARSQFLSAKTPQDMAKADSNLAGALKTLFAVSENYPELKANNNFRQLQDRISYLENQIADRREFYNDSVAVYNTRINQVPELFVARMLNYQEKGMYKVPAAERSSPEIKFDFPK